MNWKCPEHRERKTFFYDKNKDEINIQHTDGSVRVPAIENDAEYLGSLLLTLVIDLKNYNEVNEMKKKKKMITKLNI